MPKRPKDTHDREACPHHGVSRRGFIASVGAGAVVAAAGARAAVPPQAEAVDPAALTKVSLRINGRAVRVLVEPRWSLLYVLRERLGLTGTKVGCERGECGACTVLIDGQARYACLTLAVEAEGHEITTLEGLMNGEELGPVQQAFVEKDAYQCGYCTPGQIMSMEALLRANAHPTLDEVRHAMSGNLCRCGAYHNIFQAAGRAAELKGGAR
jgi:xanthine dehydrogenase YagT iron-sulfur-binding subunit